MTSEESIIGFDLFSPKKRRKTNYKKWKKKKIKKYIKFFKNGHCEWDYEYFIDLLYMKLTAMGEYFALFGRTEGSKMSVREIWRARKSIKNYYNAFKKVDGIKEPYTVAEQIEEKSLDDLFHIIRKHIRRWWD